MADLLSMLFGDSMLTGEERLRKQRAEAQAAALRGTQAPPQPQPQPVPTEAIPPQMPAQAPNRPQALPRALGGVQAPPQAPAGPAAPPVDPEQAQIDLYEGRQQDLIKQIQDASAPPDLSGAKAEYGKRAASGGHALTLALMAREAGDEFKPIQAHYLKQAAEAKEPMRVHGGTLTETGFIEDPGYAQELKVKQLTAQMTANQRIIDSNATRQEKQAAEKRLFAQQRELQAERLAMQQAIANQGNATRRDIAAASGAGGGKITEGERSAAGYLGRMEAVEGDINRLAATGQPGVVTKALGSTSLGRIARPFVESDAQQQYRAVQEDWVRAKLRKESGASIPPDEMEREIETYFPQPGETNPEVIRLKTQARAQAAEQLRSSAGRAEAVIAPRTAPAGAAPPSRPASAPVRVNTPAEAAKLPPGTPFITPSGERRVRQ
jgi:hypothetical protein